MLFNSFDFIVFLPIVFIVYWFLLKKLQHRNSFLFLASYVFYGWWDWTFLSLILFSTILDYSLGKRIEGASSSKEKKRYLVASLIGNLGVLMVFKYFNFFMESFENAFSFFGQEIAIDRLDLILPVGISFYTFQTLSYTLDVYRGEIKASNNFIEFGTYVSFFPQLVAGPIERASNLLPQFQLDRSFNYGIAANGLRQILFGFFKKIVIADNCAVYVNQCYADIDSLNSYSLILGAILFAFQIYGDFSGYSDIAIGTAKLFGFNLRKNFHYPYFSRDIAEFWRRWHISLSTWFRDYLYIPLGGSKGSKAKVIRNTFIIFLVSGFWHGANWTYVVWGGLNALFFLPLLLRERNRKHLEIISEDGSFPKLRELLGVGVTFALTVIAWVFFRAENIEQAVQYLHGMVSDFSFEFQFKSRAEVLLMMLLILVLISMEWIGRRNENTLMFVTKIRYKSVRWLIYAVIVFFLGMFSQTNETAFIYFQF